MSNKFCSAGNCKFTKSWTSNYTNRTIRNVKCSKCGRLNATKEVRQQFKPRKKKSTASSSSGSTKNTRSKSSRTWSDKHIQRSTGNVQQSSRTVTKTIYETVDATDLKESSLPNRKASIPNGAISQVPKSANFSTRLSKALIRHESIKMLSKNSVHAPERANISYQFRKFIK